MTKTTAIAAGAPPAPASRTRLLLDAPVGPTLARLAAPNLLVTCAQTAVAIADAGFVGQLSREVGVAPLAALALVFPIQSLMQMMSAGAMGGGISSAVARALGAGDRLRAEAIAQHALIITAAMAAIFTVLFGVFGRPLFALLGGEGAALDGAVAYAHVMFGGAVVVWLANTFASLIRGSGNMAVPGYVFTLTAILDVVLSGALTLGWLGLPKLGVIGPAVAFIIAFLVSALAMLVYLLAGRGNLRLRLGGWALLR